MALFAGVVGVAGAAVVATPQPAEAANISIDQCNNVMNVAGVTVACDVVVVNTLTDDPLTTGSVVTLNGGTPTASGDIVTSVTQCNDSGNGGGGTMDCNVTITNNIVLSSPSAAVAATVNQCNDNQANDGLGNAPNTCTPYPATTSGATITQCNGTGNGGGLVFPSSCTATGTVSSSLPITVNQCNGSENGGGSKVNCTVSMTTNVTTSGNGTTTTTVDGTNGNGTNGGSGGTNGGTGSTGGTGGLGTGVVGSPRFTG